MHIHIDYIKNEQLILEAQRTAKNILNERNFVDYFSKKEEYLGDRVGAAIVELAKKTNIYNGYIKIYKNRELLQSEKCIIMRFSNLNLEWLKELKVCVIFNSEYDSFATVTDTCVYELTQDGTFEESQVEYRLEDSLGTEELMYLEDKDCVRTASVLFQFSPDSDMLTEKNISKLVRHELSHISDIFEKQMTLDKQNIEETALSAYQCKYNGTVYDSILAQPTPQNITRADEHVLCALLTNQFIYLLSSSEIRARISDFIIEIRELRHKDIFPDNVTMNTQMLCRQSEQFREFSFTKYILQQIIAYVSADVKKRFVDTYIIGLWSKPTSSGRYIFGDSLMVNSDTPVVTFNKFFNMFIERLDTEFFDKISQIMELINGALKEKKMQYLSKRFIGLGLSGQQNAMFHANEYVEFCRETTKLKDFDEFTKRVNWAFV